MKVIAEYIWIDGSVPTTKLRSKPRILTVDSPINISPGNEIDPRISEWIPEWGFDGSSTFQAETAPSDCVLKPVFVVPDPFRGAPHILVLNEVFNIDGITPHRSNTRTLANTVAKKYSSHNALFGIEQEYTMYQGDSKRPLRWPENSSHFPAPQANYYCGVGCDEIAGRELFEAFLKDCIVAGIELYGANFEVMLAQAEFQLNPLPAPLVADHLWMARYLLYRRGEDFGISVKLKPKPIKGNWNGAGGHTNFSTAAMRGDNAREEIISACEKLEKQHKEHIAVYGAENYERLTGYHETSSIKQFRYGDSDRGASVRIPSVDQIQRGKKYIEDRRPAANMDPYKVSTALLETVCGEGFTPPENWVEVKFIGDNIVLM
ncbi:MAG: glutamine synthetase beta-grasp domain-containing protein [Parcubacteria group bacterium]|nr:glutamine synthetase beta-grasp domain-containing protein [Parcubacteria group bacterium]